MNITANGIYNLNSNIKSFGGSTSVIYASGDFAGATVKLAYTDEEGSVIDLVDGDILVNTQQVLEHGYGVNLNVVVAGATGSTSINIIAAGKV